MYNKEYYALIKDEKNSCGYFVMGKPDRGFVIFEDINEAQEIVNKLLEDGAEIYNDLNAFFSAYPQFTNEERIARQKENLKRMLSNKKE